MQRITSRFLLGSVILWVGAGAQGPATGDFEPLQGVWMVTAAEQGGRPFDITGGVLRIDGEAFALRTAIGNEFSGTLWLNAAASPKQLDFVHSDGAVWEGIYAVSGDVFRLNYVERGDAERPTVFATTADTFGTVIVMRKDAE